MIMFLKHLQVYNDIHIFTHIHTYIYYDRRSLEDGLERYFASKLDDVCFLNTSHKCLCWFVSVVVRQCQWVCAGVWARKRDGDASSPVASKHATESEIPRVRVWSVGVKNSLRCLWLFGFPDTSWAQSIFTTVVPETPFYVSVAVDWSCT